MAINEQSVNVAMTFEMYDAVTAMAKRTERSRSAVLRYAVQLLIEKEEKELAASA